jgi:ubiquinone/menaquinone biosynthesis C-methylase UbiE
MLQFAQLGFPEMYERALVRPLFQPWAEDMIRRVGIAPGERVLDIACGTGIAARLAKQYAGSKGRVVGVDVNPGMLSVARSVAPDIEWREGDAAALPVGANELYDVVICQQGLQFFPQRGAAVAEMHRVLTVGGRLGVSTWRSDEEMPVLRELRSIAERRVGPISDRRHSFVDPDDLRALLTNAGFDQVNVEPVTQVLRFEDGAAFIHLNAMALIGMSAAAKELNDEGRAKMLADIVADSRRVLDRHTDGLAFTYEIGANVATASR